MQYTAFDRCKLFKQKDFKAKGFVIIANKLAMNLFFLIGPILFRFRYIIDIIDIYECISLFIYPLK